MPVMPRLLLVCVAFLVLAPAAAGKGDEYRVCGASGCERLPESAGLAGLFGARAVAPPAAPAPFYEFRGSSHHGREVVRWAYVPSARAVWRSGGTWTRLTRLDEARWREAVRGLSPFATRTVRRATVGGKPVRDPASYLAL
jgi:hypothetical protein